MKKRKKINRKNPVLKSINNIMKNIMKNRVSIFTMLAILIVIAIIVLVIILIVNNVKVSKYKPYESKIKQYGFESLYDNSSCKSSNKVTKSEAVKMAVASVLNVLDITDLAEENNEYKNATWVDYAKHFKIIEENEINIKNYNDKVKYFDVVRYFENAKKALTDLEIKSIDYVAIKNAEKYDPDVQAAFSDMIANKIIVVNTKNINANEKAFKGQVNELVVNFLEQYSLISIERSRLRFTDMPSNSAAYPYILFDVPTNVYEYEFATSTPLKEPMNAKELYTYKKQYYYQIKEYVEGYYEKLLNVDYRDINLITYTENLNEYVVFDSLTTSAYEYVEYVRNNHIKLSADVTMIEPCVYFDGASYRVRIKIDLNIIETDTRDNLVLYDAIYGDKVTYNKDSYTIYADAKLTNAIDSELLFMESPVVLNDIILNKNDLDITYVSSDVNV